MSVLSKLTAIADAIRNRAGKTEKLTLDAMANGVDAVYEAGKKQQESDFMDKYQDYGNRTHYSNAFAGKGWTEETYKPKYPIVPTEAASNTFWLSDIVDTIVNIDFSQTTTANPQPFGYCGKLKRIPYVKVRSGMVYTNWFLNDFALEEITFDGVIDTDLNMGQCIALSPKSIQGTIMRLSSTVTGKTLTLSKVAVENADASGEMVSSFEVLKAMYPNWTFSLV